MRRYDEGTRSRIPSCETSHSVDFEPIAELVADPLSTFVYAEGVAALEHGWRPRRVWFVVLRPSSIDPPS
jgi:hypothetical protein